MTITIYSSKKDADETRLLEHMVSASTRICRKVDQIQKQLNTVGDIRKIVIVIIRNHQEVAKLIRLVELNSDILLIVIATQSLFEAATDIHKLRPRYIAFKEGDFQDVATVLRRITDQLLQGHA